MAEAPSSIGIPSEFLTRLHEPIKENVQFIAKLREDHLASIHDIETQMENIAEMEKIDKLQTRNQTATLKSARLKHKMAIRNIDMDMKLFWKELNGLLREEKMVLEGGDSTIGSDKADLAILRQGSLQDILPPSAAPRKPTEHDLQVAKARFLKLKEEMKAIVRAATSTQYTLEVEADSSSQSERSALTGKG